MALQAELGLRTNSDRMLHRMHGSQKGLIAVRDRIRMASGASRLGIDSMFPIAITGG
jgi:hypothetical protein